MVVKVYISGISGNKEVKKRQQRVCMILESKNITFEAIDITEPGKEPDKEFMQQNSNAKDAKHPLPPQIFSDETYCGDYDEFDLANENDELEKFLKVPVSSPAGSTANVENGHVANGNTSSRENSADKEAGDQQVPERYDSVERPRLTFQLKIHISYQRNVLREVEKCPIC
uniref:Uncharacterized protein n=1 Tax=Graphocephala atropunctata TaxID=36148 RepID=A0A1B6KHB2_9HEMI